MYQFYNGLPDQVRRSPNVMRIIASMLSKRKLLIPGFRDVIGVNYALRVRVKTGEYDYLLLSATESGLTSIVNILLDAGADKEVKDEYGRTPLDVAAWEGHTDIVKLLLDAGADKEVKDRDGRTPLHFAAMHKGHTDIVKLLVDAGADLEVKDDRGWTPLRYAAMRGLHDIYNLLKSPKSKGGSKKRRKRKTTKRKSKK